MELKFKNPMVKSSVEKFINMEGDLFGFSNNKKCALESMAFNIPIGFFASLCDSVEICESAFESHPTLELTYETVEHLPLILVIQHGDYVLNHDMDKDYAISITKKTLASYLMLLCMNEHMCFPTIQRLENIDEIMKSAELLNKRPDDSWMGFSIKVGVNEEIDLLHEMGNAVQLNEEGYLRISFSNIVELYKRMCGVDLYKYKLEDAEIRSE